MFAFPEMYNNTDVANIKKDFKVLLDQATSFKNDLETTLDESFKHCLPRYTKDQNDILLTGTLLNEFLTTGDIEAKELFVSTCNDTDHHFGKCIDTLSSMISFLDQYYLKNCNLIEELYDMSYYSPQKMFFKGYRDYYMRAAGNTQILANLALIIDTTFQSFRSNDKQEYKDEFQRFGSSF